MTGAKVTIHNHDTTRSLVVGVVGRGGKPSGDQKVVQPQSVWTTALPVEGHLAVAEFVPPPPVENK